MQSSRKRAVPAMGSHNKIATVAVLALVLLHGMHGMHAVRADSNSNQGPSNRDHSYYPEGVTNPNSARDMYWKDSINVLEDLAQFSKLYVQYHSCAWSPLEYSMFGNDNGNSHDGEDIIPNCGANYDEEDMWYLGKTPCYRANVAFSLYGVLKGHRDTLCQKSTFINSFHTIGGLEAWINSMQSLGYFSGYSTQSALVDYDDNNNNNNNNNNRRKLAYFDNKYDKKVLGSYCTNNMPYYDDDYSNAGGGFENNNDDDGGGGGGGDAGDFNGQTLPTYDGVYSYGVGCAANGRFQMFEFEGKYCHADQVTRRLDKLQQFNRAIQKQKCVKIYDASSSSSYNANNNNNNNNDGNNQQQNPLSLLKQSRACTIELSNAPSTTGHSRNTCPDPYGKLKMYSNVLNRATKNVPASLWVGTSRLRKLCIWATIFMLFLGTVFMVLTFDSRLRKTRRLYRRARRRLKYVGDRSLKQNRSTVTMNTTMDTALDESNANQYSEAVDDSIGTNPNTMTDTPGGFDASHQPDNAVAYEVNKAQSRSRTSTLEPLPDDELEDERNEAGEGNSFGGRMKNRVFGGKR